MGRQEEKLIKDWLENTPVSAPKDKVMAFLKKHFPGRYKQKSTSHIVVRDERLKGLEGFGFIGILTIPVSGGQSVKGKYLRDLARAAIFIRDLEGK